MEKELLHPKCEEIGHKIDKLTIEKRYGELETYLAQIETSFSAFDTSESILFFYYLGTGKSILASHFDELKKISKVSSASSYQKQSLFYMRKALEIYEESNSTNKEILLPIYTNYANELLACGRVIEALRIYRKAISINDKFSMCIGNYGRALNLYANTVNDSNHYNILHCYAYQSMKKAVTNPDVNLHEDAKKYFMGIISKYDSLNIKDYLSSSISFDEYDLGKSEERSYRLWCLKNHLFLNPLNDLIEQYTAFAHDPLTIIQFTEYVNKNEMTSIRSISPPKWYSMLNQLKEEYIYTRFICYEGSEKMRQLHYADKNVLLANADYNMVNYSIRMEQLKSAFKGLYSIFDQIAFFINEFWALGLQEREACAAKVFVCSHYPINNIALRALYWSNCEFSEKFGNADKASERDLKILRNALEHKFVKVHEYDYNGSLQIEDDGFYHIDEEQLKSLVLRLLVLAREWIMELVYAIGIEESKKGDRGDAINLDICDFDDQWKI